VGDEAISYSPFFFGIIAGMDSIPDDPGKRGAVAVAMRDGRMLVIRRAATVVAPLVYCFPGGGIEEGETEEQALVREFREEVGMSLRPVRRLWHCTTPWKVQLAWWLGELQPEETPTPNPHEVHSVHWFTAKEMAQLPDLLTSNREFLRLVECGEIHLDHEQENA
jgi:8-oxo-dGTP pyrophosphatase MutT (NUDIX family)